MRRDSVDVSAAVRQRLELLGRGPDGTPHLPAAPQRPDVAGAPLEPILVLPPGRHARVSVPGWLRAIRERVPWSPAHLAVLAVVMAVALGAVAWMVLRSAPRAVPAPLVGLASDAAGPPNPVLVSSTPPTVAANVVIDVAGKVRRPGVTTLPAGSRVIDALRQAGGARSGVDLRGLNLARILIDGEQILVGVPFVAGSVAGLAPGPAVGALINLNTANLEDLESLPGVGPVTAAKIVGWRTEHGAFTSVDELLEVDGIGTKTLAELTPHVTL